MKVDPKPINPDLEDKGPFQRSTNFTTRMVIRLMSHISGDRSGVVIEIVRAMG